MIPMTVVANLQRHTLPARMIKLIIIVIIIKVSDRRHTTVEQIVDKIGAACFERRRYAKCIGQITRV